MIVQQLVGGSTTIGHQSLISCASNVSTDAIAFALLVSQPDDEFEIASISSASTLVCSSKEIAVYGRWLLSSHLSPRYLIPPPLE